MNPNEFINDIFKAHSSSYQARDSQRLHVACEKSKYEETLDEMWGIYMVNPGQIVEYNAQIAVIKDCGCKVYRNSAGKHKIKV